MRWGTGWRMKIESLPQDELIGLMMEVEESTNRDMRGLRGRVVDETRNTFVIETEPEPDPHPHPNPKRGVQQVEKRIPKAGNTFIFVLDGGLRVRIRGDKLVARPEDRIRRGMPR